MTDETQTDTAAMAQIDQHIEEHLDYWLDQLGRLCAQPSVSAQHDGIDDCARLVETILREQGFAAQIIPSAGNPVVYAEGHGSNHKTLLFYLHYDVQPPGARELWDSPPFELSRRNDHVYARGVVDDKGHIICRLAALAAVKEVLGELPCHIKFVIEGEEEVGSPSMSAFVETHQNLLAADACIWEFGGVDYEDRPTQTLGMRGMCYVQLSVQTANRDAHSGLGGTIFPNAAWRLTWALSSIKDQNERVQIPGFYDNVKPPSERDLELLEKLPDESTAYRESYGLQGFVSNLSGGLAFKKAAVFDPSCTICGLDSGYQSAGIMTVLPAQARAKLGFRLVPDQTPEEIYGKLRAHLDAQGFSDVKTELLGGGRPAKVDPDDPFVRLTNQAAAEVYGQEPVVEPMIGGSGPNYPFVHVLGLPLVSAGVGYPGTRAHAPNENMRIADFIKGTKHTARIIARFGST